MRVDMEVRLDPEIQRHVFAAAGSDLHSTDRRHDDRRLVAEVLRPGKSGQQQRRNKQTIHRASSLPLGSLIAADFLSPARLICCCAIVGLATVHNAFFTACSMSFRSSSPVILSTM